METQPLKDYLASHSEIPPLQADHSHKAWYNQYGDCIEFQTEQVAIVAERIDTYLTIYRAADTNIAIGFQLKDIHALMKKYHAHLGVMWCTVDKTLIAVSSLLLTALEEELPLSIKKRQGYDEAMKQLANDVEVTVGN